jgi:hypothetical protein
MRALIQTDRNHTSGLLNQSSNLQPLAGLVPQKSSRKSQLTARERLMNHDPQIEHEYSSIKRDERCTKRHETSHFATFCNILAPSKPL